MHNESILTLVLYSIMKILLILWMITAAESFVAPRPARLAVSSTRLPAAVEDLASVVQQALSSQVSPLLQPVDHDLATAVTNALSSTPSPLLSGAAGAPTPLLEWALPVLLLSCSLAVVAAWSHHPASSEPTVDPLSLDKHDVAMTGP